MCILLIVIHMWFMSAGDSEREPLNSLFHFEMRCILRCLLIKNILLAFHSGKVIDQESCDVFLTSRKKTLSGDFNSSDNEREALPTSNVTAKTGIFPDAL